jgi:NitT/TauT family transport system substrate-binding protein
VESGRIDAAGLSGGDHFRLLRRDPSLRVLVDANSPEGMRDIFGGDFWAGGALSARQEWLDRNPETARRLARALQRTLHWISTHTPEEIRERLPVSSRSPDAAMDVEILRWSLPTFTADGRMPKGAPEAMKRMLDQTVDKVRDSKIDLAATWTDEFLPAPK